MQAERWIAAAAVGLTPSLVLPGQAAGRPVFTYAAETRLDAWVMQFGRHFAVEPGIQLYGTPGVPVATLR
ncbi:MAG TPA: hypothetical protein VEI03_03410 [Stellaceae bacterium]|nr:hypothetical protein [Stellaceae bacterium]